LTESLGQRQESYSIDECFIDLAGITGNLTLQARKIRTRVARATGIGQTKTLAKIAHHIAKSVERKPVSNHSQHALVCHLSALPDLEREALLRAVVADRKLTPGG